MQTGGVSIPGHLRPCPPTAHTGQDTEYTEAMEGMSDSLGVGPETGGVSHPQGHGVMPRPPAGRAVFQTVGGA